MKIVVCIKQVPDTNEVKIDPKTGTLIREGVPSIINPDDKNALEEALVLKDKHGAHVTVISMGPPQAEKALREGWQIVFVPNGASDLNNSVVRFGKTWTAFNLIKNISTDADA